MAWSGTARRGQDVTLKIAKSLPIKGRLTDLQGKPITGAKVNVESVAAAEKDDLTGTYNAYRVNPEFAGRALSLWLDGRATGENDVDAFRIRRRQQLLNRVDVIDVPRLIDGTGAERRSRRRGQRGRVADQQHLDVVPRGSVVIGSLRG